jgi:PmbA protein
LEKGDRTLDEMISEVKDGVYITNVWYTRFANYRTGDFSTIPRDAMFEIKNGRITRPIKGVRITDNMQRILENILAISKNPQQIEWWEITSPIITGHVLVKDLNLTKSAK